jgi:hypothetical protein
MNNFIDLNDGDLSEIKELEQRALKIVGRRKFMSTAAKIAAFSIPASLVTVVPKDALAAGSGGGGTPMAPMAPMTPMV